MATFLGTETYAIDDKNRIVVPAGMRHTGERKQPLTRFVMMRGLDGCIWLYAHEDWKRLEDLLQRLSTGPKAHRAFAPLSSTNTEMRLREPVFTQIVIFRPRRTLKRSMQTNWLSRWRALSMLFS